MEYGSIVLAVASISTSAFVCLRSLRTWQQNRMKIEKSRLIGKALKLAEANIIKYEERYDRILNHICSQYLINQALLEALRGARDAMEEALEFVIDLRELEIEAFSNFLDDGAAAADGGDATLDLIFDRRQR